MKNITYYLLADDSEYYSWSATEQEVKVLLFLKFGVPFLIINGIPFVVTKVVSCVSGCIAGCVIAYDYTKLPVTLGSFHLTLINPIKVVQGACLLRVFTVGPANLVVVRPSVGCTNYWFSTSARISVYGSIHIP